MPGPFMYAQIANYSPAPYQEGAGTYDYSGMGGVTTPEALVHGEAFARSANEFAGLGAAPPQQPQQKPTLNGKGKAACAAALVLGGAIGFGVGWWLRGRG